MHSVAEQDEKILSGQRCLAEAFLLLRTEAVSP
jgi:hypothetical protein